MPKFLYEKSKLPTAEQILKDEAEREAWLRLHPITILPPACVDNAVSITPQTIHRGKRHGSAAA